MGGLTLSDLANLPPANEKVEAYPSVCRLAAGTHSQLSCTANWPGTSIPRQVPQQKEIEKKQQGTNGGGGALEEGQLRMNICSGSVMVGRPG